MDDCLIVVNAGSSSIKFAIHSAAPPFEARLRGLIEGIGTAPHLRLRDAAGATTLDRRWPKEGFDHAAAVRAMLALGPDVMAGMKPRAVGHRVVHGGMEFAGPVLVRPAVIASLEALCPLAPLHQPHNLAPIRAVGNSHRSCPKSRASTPRSTGPSPILRNPSRCRGRSPIPGSAATASTGSPTSSSPAGCLRWIRRSRSSALSSRIWAMARASAPWSAVEASPAPWASPPWTG